MSKAYGQDGVGIPLELGKGGPKITESAGVIQQRDATNSVFARTQGADAVAADDYVTFRQLNGVGALSRTLYVDGQRVLDGLPNGDGSIAQPFNQIQDAQDFIEAEAVSVTPFDYTWEVVITQPSLMGPLTVAASQNRRITYKCIGSTPLDTGPDVGNVTVNANSSATRVMRLRFEGLRVGNVTVQGAAGGITDLRFHNCSVGIVSASTVSDVFLTISADSLKRDGNQTLAPVYGVEQVLMSNSSGVLEAFNVALNTLGPGQSYVCGRVESCRLVNGHSTFADWRSVVPDAGFFDCQDVDANGNQYGFAGGAYADGVSYDSILGNTGFVASGTLNRLERSGGANRVTDTDWYIDPSTGNDTNDGLDPSRPLRSFEGLQARWGADPVVTQDTTIHILNDLTFTDAAVALRATVVGAAQIFIVGEPNSDSLIGTMSAFAVQDSATGTYGSVTTSVPHGLGNFALVTSSNVDPNAVGWVDSVTGASSFRQTNFYILQSGGNVVQPGNLTGANILSRRVYVCIGGARLRVSRAGYNTSSLNDAGNAPVVLRYLRFTAPGFIDVQGGNRYSGAEFQACYLDAQAGGVGEIQLTKCLITSGFRVRSLKVALTGCSFHGSLWTDCAATNNDDRLATSASDNQQYIGGPVRLEGQTSMEIFRTGFEDNGFVQLRSPDCFVRAFEPFGTTGAAYVYDAFAGGHISLQTRPTITLAAATDVFQLGSNSLSLDQIPALVPEIGAWVSVEDEDREAFFQQTGTEAGGNRRSTFVSNANGRQIWFGPPGNFPSGEPASGVIVRGTGTSFDITNYTAPGDLERRYYIPLGGSLYSVLTDANDLGMLDTIDD